jgi:uncharacterized protein YceH (UPF0502 family)
VERLAKRPGEREERWRQLLGDTEPRTAAETPAPARAPESALEERVTRLERELAELRELVAQRL